MAVAMATAAATRALWAANGNGMMMGIGIPPLPLRIETETTNHQPNGVAVLGPFKYWHWQYLSKKKKNQLSRLCESQKPNNLRQGFVGIELEN